MHRQVLQDGEAAVISVAQALEDLKNVSGVAEIANAVLTRTDISDQVRSYVFEVLATLS